MDMSYELILAVSLGLGALGSIGYLIFRNYIKNEIREETQSREADAVRPASSAARQSAPVPTAPAPAPAAPTPAELREPAESLVPAASSPVSAPIKLDVALAKTKSSLFGRIKGLFAGGRDRLSADDRESLEEILYTSDLGPKTVERLLEAVDSRLTGDQGTDLNQVRTTLREEILAIFSEVQRGPATSSDVAEVLHFAGTLPTKPQVWLVVGVNGVGKTTTIGKLAYAVARSGKKVLVAAGDTFRAAAGEQLKVWSERAQVEIFSPEGVKDPSAVAFDACQMGLSRGFDVVIVDTAGRLHTQDNLMEELRKIKRVVQKVLPTAPHETLLVLDANSGQNALMQARKFHEILELSGVVLTKMDGTAKGGVAVGLACELELPIRLIGVGEGIDDLRPFRSTEFVDSII